MVESGSKAPACGNEAHKVSSSLRVRAKRNMELNLITKVVIVAFAILVAVKIILWHRRIWTLKKSMPVVPTLFPPESLFRLLWPKKWQTFHVDWYMEQRRSVYRKLKSDNFALVCLFEYDRVYVTTPEAVSCVHVSQADSFPKDMALLRRVCCQVFVLKFEILIVKQSLSPLDRMLVRRSVMNGNCKGRLPRGPFRRRIISLFTRKQPGRHYK